MSNHQSTQMNPQHRGTSGFNFNIITRIVGIGLVFLGISIAYKVVTTAWDLFDDSSRIILPLSQEIEVNTAVNQFIGSVTSSSNKFFRSHTNHNSQLAQQDNTLSLSGSVDATTPVEQLAISTTKSLNLAYFIAWGIVLILLGLISKIAVSLIAVGGNLASDHFQRKQITSLVKTLAAEIKRA